jgi:hypothetical protein
LDSSFEIPNQELHLESDVQFKSVNTTDLVINDVPFVDPTDTVNDMSGTLTILEQSMANLQNEVPTSSEMLAINTTLQSIANTFTSLGITQLGHLNNAIQNTQSFPSSSTFFHGNCKSTARMVFLGDCNNNIEIAPPEFSEGTRINSSSSTEFEYFRQSTFGDDNEWRAFNENDFWGGSYLYGLDGNPNSNENFTYNDIKYDGAQIRLTFPVAVNLYKVKIGSQSNIVTGIIFVRDNTTGVFDPIPFTGTPGSDLYVDINRSNIERVFITASTITPGSPNVKIGGIKFTIDKISVGDYLSEQNR